MRRIAALLLLLVSGATTVLLTAAGGDPPVYRVRAIFDTAFTLGPGEDVKIAGVPVGKVESLDLTPANRAAVVLDIDRPGFQDFRADASCTIRLESLVGERYVACTPTRPRRAGRRPAPPLPVIPAGRPGAGEHLLPVEHTSRPVDLDLVGDTMRLPVRERLPILLGELGVGLAANGPALAQAIDRADPALRQADRVLAILAGQNRTLQRLVTHAERVLAPLARRRAQAAGAVSAADTVSAAAASRAPALERAVRELPGFLHQLQPTLAQLGGLARRMTPVVANVGAVAPQVDRVVERLGPFSAAATPALNALGHAADRGRAALVAARPVIATLRSFAHGGRPLARDLAAFTGSFARSGGIEDALRYVLFQAAAMNGFDALGHYLRADLLTDTCASWAKTENRACSARFTHASGQAAASGAAAASGRARALDYLLGP